MSIKSRVKYFLETVSDARNSDNLLIALMWAQDLSNKKKEKETEKNNEDEVKELPEKTKKFLRCLAEGELTNFDSIRKAKGIVLKEFPELRGK